MEVKIENIDSEEFRADLTRALAKSVIGDVVMNLIQGAAKDYKVKEAIESVVREHMTRHARDIIAKDEEFQEKMRTKVQATITEELLDQLIAKIRIDRY